jgi:hypothetical protein
VEKAPRSGKRRKLPVQCFTHISFAVLARFVFQLVQSEIHAVLYFGRSRVHPVRSKRIRSRRAGREMSPLRISLFELHQYANRLTCNKTNMAERRRNTSQEPRMARYIARFMKNVLGDNGHEAEICQSSIEVEARSSVHAAELAKTKFCETEKVRDWSLHADRVHVADAEFSM